MKYTENEMKTFYRKLFGTPHGRIVLEDMLADLHYFDIYLDKDNEEAIALNNYSKVLLYKIGVLDNDADKILNKLLELEPKYEEEKNG